MDILTGGLVLNLYTLFLVLMLLLFQENDRKSNSNILFIKLLSILTFLVGVSVVGDICEIVGGDFLVINKICTYITFAFDPFGFLFSLSYIDNFTINADRKKRNLFLLPARFLAYFNFMMVTLSVLFDMKLFYYYEGDVYHRGNFFIFSGMLLVFLCFLVLAYAAVFRDNILNGYRKPILLFPVIVAVGGLLQVFVININIEYAATVFACLILFIYVQKKDVNLDYLTGAVNRRGFDVALRKAIIESKDRDFAAIMIDVDFFKNINDTYGHRTGDEVLENIADVLKESFDQDDIVGRFGGDEFCVITQIVDEDELNTRIDLVKESIASIDWSQKRKMTLSVSVGSMVYNKESGMKAKDFMESIDKRMYEEKLTHHLTDRRKGNLQNA